MKLPQDYIDKIYILSDTHYGHKNICRGVSEWDLSDRGGSLGVRDFDTLEDMNKALVNNINSLVSEDAILIHLGDWSFGGKQNIEIFRNQIMCKTIHLVTGNHDAHIKTGSYDHLFTSRQAELKLSIGGLFFHLYHHPIASWDEIRRGSYHLHGHQHWSGDDRFSDGRCMDVGVDGNGLYPYKLVDVIEMLKDRKKYDPKDHHTY